MSWASRRATGRNLRAALYAAALLGSAAMASAAVAASEGGTGRAVAGVCIAGGMFAGIAGGGLMRLPPVGRVFVLLAFAAGIITAAAASLDLSRGGW
jgi:hypothetical protein